MEKLAIVGTGTGTRDNAPWGDPSFDIWVLNEAANNPWCKRWDACFQLHKEEVYIRPDNKKDEHNWEWLQRDHGKPIYMQAFDPRVPDCVVYPLQDAIDLVGVSYLSATICMAMALAVLKGYQNVEFWGVEMSFTEYQFQADCYRFWMGFLKGRLGAEHVTWHCGEQLFKAPIYGYEGNYRFDPKFFQQRINALDTEWSNADSILKNAKKSVERLLANDDIVHISEKVLEYQKAAVICGQYAGALAEAEKYIKVSDRQVDRGTFERTAAQAQIDGNKKSMAMYMAGGKVELIGEVWARKRDNRAKPDLYRHIQNYSQLAYDMGVHYGVNVENLTYINKFDEMVRANGGYIAPAPVTLPQMVGA